jgi:hypothetical protein
MRPNTYCPFEPDEVKGVLDEAARMVTELELAEDLRLPAFNFAVQALLMRQAELPAGGSLLAGIPLPGNLRAQ